MRRLRVLLADDHRLMLEGLSRILEADFELAGTAQDGRALLAAATDLKPDLILLDISMPALNGIDAARQLRKIVPRAKLIFLTMRTDPTYVAAAFRAGASGYVLKQSAASELLEAIRQVARGRRYVTPLVARRLANRPAAALDPERQPAELTARQREVLQLVAEGHSGKQIAAALRISIKTVEYHKAGIMQKLGLRTTAELTRFALDHGIVGE